METCPVKCSYMWKMCGCQDGVAGIVGTPQVALLPGELPRYPEHAEKSKGS